MKPLLIGEAPSRRTAATLPLASERWKTYARPLAGESGDRLRSLYRAATSRELDRDFDVRNLLDWYPGRAGKGSRLPLAEARWAADVILAEIDLASWPRPTFVWLGRRVADAFHVAGARNLPYLRRLVFVDFDAYVVPHPSRVNRWWNDRAHRAAARVFFREFVARELDRVG